MEVQRQGFEQEAILLRAQIADLQSSLAARERAEESLGAENKELTSQLKAALEANERLMKENSRMEAFIQSCNVAHILEEIDNSKAINVIE